MADVRNTGGRHAGAITAGLFLKEFVGSAPWVHVDIAGPSSASKEYGHVSKGGTGFAAAAILEFLRRAAA
jgi:leucyl aminopeptidase